MAARITWFVAYRLRLAANGPAHSREACYRRAVLYSGEDPRWVQVYEQSVGRGLLGVCAESWVRTGRRATEMVAAAPQCHWPLGAGQMLMCVLCLRKRATENIARAAVGLAAAEREQCTGRGHSGGGGRCCRRRRRACGRRRGGSKWWRWRYKRLAAEWTAAAQP